MKSLVIMARVLGAIVVGFGHILAPGLRFSIRYRIARRATTIQEYYDMMEDTGHELTFWSRIALAMGLME